MTSGSKNDFRIKKKKIMGRYTNFALKAVYWLFISVTSSIIFPVSAFPNQSYQVIGIGLMDGEQSFAKDINNQGVVIGDIVDNSPLETRIFSWQDGVVEIIGVTSGYRNRGFKVK